MASFASSVTTGGARKPAWTKIRFFQLFLLVIVLWFCGDTIAPVAFLNVTVQKVPSCETMKKHALTGF